MLGVTDVHFAFDFVDRFIHKMLDYLTLWTTLGGQIGIHFTVTVG